MLVSMESRGPDSAGFAIYNSDKNKTYPIKYLAKLIDFTFAITKAPLILNYMPSQKKEINRLKHGRNIF